MRITVPNYKLPSWNHFYAGRSHWARQLLVSQAKEALMISGINKKRLIKERVDIKVTAFYKDKRHRDPDNVCAKLMIDCLKGKVIEDDDYRFVRRVTTEVIAGAKTEQVIIEVKTTS